MRSPALLCILGALAGCGSATPGPRGQISELWGRSGELWSPRSRLPDFSFAGYHFGDDPIPQVPVRATVTDFGAKGDGVSDDTEPFLKAIASTSNGAVLIPPGRFKITQVLKLTRSGVVIRGAGREATVLYFPKPLVDMIGPSPDWAGTNTAKGRWSWGGGVIWCEGRDAGVRLADVTAPASRGDTALTLSSTAGLAAGQTIRLVQHDPPDDSLGRHLHAEQSPAGAGMLKALDGRLVDWAARIASISGNRVTLDRPLRVDVRPEWKPEIFSSAPGVQELGLENFTIEFPDSPYEGHFTEKGFNGIFFDGIHHSWVRNVAILD